MYKPDNKYRVGQSSHRKDPKSKNYSWCVWLNESEEVLDQIESVEYLLHPTFKERVHEKSNASDQFKLCASGWGEFMIHITVTEKSGDEVKMEYWLTLRDDLTREQAPTRGFDPMMPEETPSNQPKSVYLSYTAFNSKFARDLQKALESDGIEILASPEARFGIGESLLELTRQTIAQADAVVVFTAPIENRVQELELEMAEELDIQVIPVSVGDYKTPKLKGSLLESLLKVNEGDRMQNLKDKIIRLL